MCSLGSVWYITHGCGSYPALPYPGRRPFQPYTVLGTQGNYVPFHRLPFLYSITHPTTFLLYHARPYPIYHPLSLCIPSIHSQDIERKRSRNHGLSENSIPPYNERGGIIRAKRPTADLRLYFDEILHNH